MDVILVGNGNVATVLGRLLVQHGHGIKAVAARNEAAAGELAAELNSAACPLAGVEAIKAQVVLIALSDTALGTPLSISHADAVVAHTAGSVSMDVLKNYSPHTGVFYPLQSLNKNNRHLPTVPLLIQGSSAHAQNVLLQLAHSVSPVVAEANDEARMQYHVGAVLVSNFTNYLYKTAEAFCVANGISFAALQPLIEETALRLRVHKPAAVQTGPAVRNDQVTIQKHLSLLQHNQELAGLYEYLSRKIAEENLIGKAL